MPPCPDAAALRELLNGTLGSPASDTVATHIGGCSTCQSALEELTSSTFHSWKGQPGDLPRPEFLDRLKRDPVARPERRATVLPAIPGYEILEELGRGGVGTVYKARHLALHRIVALKVLASGGLAGSELRSRFRTEALVTSNLGHPNVVQVYEVGEWTPPSGGEPLPYVCLEYVGGGTLARRINRTPQPPAAAAELMRQVASAVHAAHEQSVVHRDIKPENVLLDLATGQPKVADFGLAKQLALGSGRTHTGLILGTPSYMAPEQARGDSAAVDRRTDVYGLGAVLYELLTGRPPFLGPTPLDTVVLVAKTDPVAPRQVQPTVPRDLETICLKCLAKEQDRRYPTALAFADDLQRFLDGRPIQARPIGPFGRVAKWARRNPVPTALLTLIALIVIGSVVSLTALYLEAERARKASDDERGKTQDALRDAQAATKQAQRATAEARVSAEQAQKAAAGVRSVSEFFQRNVLAAPRPSGEGAGTEVTLRQAIEEAEAKIQQQFTGQPEIEAAIRDTLTNTYYARSEYEKARAQAERVLALRKSYLDADDAELLSAQNNLALTSLQTGRFTEAESLLKETLAGRTRKFGADHSATLSSMNSFAGYLIFSGQLNEAAKLLRAALDIHERATTPNPVAALTVRGNLSSVLTQLERLPEAERLARAVLTEREKTLPADHPDTILTLNTLSDLLRKSGKLDEAERYADRAIAASEKTFGLNTPKVLAAHLRRISAHGERDIPRADKEFRELMKRSSPALPAHHPERLVCLSDWAIFLIDHGRHADATPWVDELLAHHRRHTPKDNPLLATTLILHAECLLAAGKPADAEKDVREALAIREKKLPEKHWNIANARSLLGGCVAEQKQFKLAESLLTESYESLRKSDDVPPARLAAARARVRKLYTDWGNPTEAAKW